MGRSRSYHRSFVFFRQALVEFYRWLYGAEVAASAPTPHYASAAGCANVKRIDLHTSHNRSIASCTLRLRRPTTDCFSDSQSSKKSVRSGISSLHIKSPSVHCVLTQGGSLCCLLPSERMRGHRHVSC